MAGEWREATVGEIASSERNALVGGPFGSYLVSRDYVDSGVPVIRGQNMGERWICGEFAYVTAGKADSLSANIARPGDVIFTQRGTLGQVAVVPKDTAERYVISQSQMKLTVNDAIADPLFVYYVFRSSEQRDYVLQNAIQTGVPHTNLGILRGTPLPLPPLSEQRAIAHILGTLDDKIELNRRMNETLEEMARTLFKSWFVDFDPVRAKSEGRDPGLPEHIADLFPERFEDSESGKIPAGWAIEPLDKVAHFLNGLALQKYPPEDGDHLPAIKIAELRKGVTASSGRASTKIPPQYVVEDGDTLFSWSGSLEVQLWTGGRGALNQHLFKVTSERYPKWLCYYWIKQHLAGFRSIAADKATTMGHIKRRHLADALTVVPPDPMLQEMDLMMEPIVSKILNNNLQAHVLVTIRDALLHRLISGELRVEESSLLDGAD